MRLLNLVSGFFSRNIKTAQSQAGQEFDFVLVRQLVEEAGAKTEKMLGQKGLSFIMPYGFEVFGLKQEDKKPFWPKKVARHYPAIGYPAELNANEAAHVAHIWLAEFKKQLHVFYPDFGTQLKFIQIHNNGHFSQMKPKQVGQFEKVHVMDIELFPIAAPITNILDHYAQYILCLFGAISNKGKALPEIAEFNVSKTRRNRLFQLYVMIEAITKHLPVAIPAMTLEQKEIYEGIFALLRHHDTGEIFRSAGYSFFPYSSLQMLPEEKAALDRLIYPRMDSIRQALTKLGDKPLSTYYSVPYYNGRKKIQVSMNDIVASQIIAMIKRSYLDFPASVAEYKEQAKENLLTLKIKK